MIHWLQAPKSSTAADYLECFWLIEKKPDADSFDFPILNPDPCAHFIISPKDQAYQYDKANTSMNGLGCHLLFPHLQSMRLDHSQPFVHLGIKFKVGALYNMNIPNCSHPLLDHIEPLKLSTLINNNSINEAELLALARTAPDACCDLLENQLMPWLISLKKDKYSELTAKAIKVLNGTIISEIGHLLHCSQRTLERTFNKVTGLTLKQCQSMNKLEAMLEYLYQKNTDEINWAEVACQFGFSDQPHLIRYLKTQVGLTPNIYAKERSLTIDVYGGVSQRF